MPFRFAPKTFSVLATVIVSPTCSPWFATLNFTIDLPNSSSVGKSFASHSHGLSARVPPLIIKGFEPSVPLSTVKGFVLNVLVWMVNGFDPSVPLCTVKGFEVAKVPD